MTTYQPEGRAQCRCSRCSVPEPAAPAVDDELLTAVAREIYLSFGVELPPVNHAYMTAVLNTDAFKRLRAAWTAEVGKSAYGDTPISYIRELEREVADVKRERDEAITTTDRISRIGEQAALTLGDENRRLRAAQPALPDLPPVRNVKRDGDYVVVDLGHNCGAYETRESAADMAALGLAALTLFDAEAAAADTTPDDENPRVQRVRQYVGTLERLDSLPQEYLRYARMIARDLRHKLDMEPQPDLDRARQAEGGAA